MSEQASMDSQEIYSRFHGVVKDILVVVGDTVALSVKANQGEVAINAITDTYTEKEINDKRVITVAAIAICDAAKFWPEDTSFGCGMGEYPHG